MTVAHYIQTPLLLSHPLSQLTGKHIYLKMEALQNSGSFKDRGIGNLCRYYAKQGQKGLVSSSGGNAGIAVAYAGKMLGLDVKIIVPNNTALICVNKMLAEDADVITEGAVWNEADQYARELAKELNYAYIPPFDHLKIWEGYESIIDEIKATKIKPDAIITSVGGGGLFSGLAQGLDKHKWSDVALITAETTGAATLAKSVAAKDRIVLDKIDTIATTLGAKQICQRAYDLIQTHVVHPEIITDPQAVQALLNFADDHHLLVEPACGAALAIAYENRPILDHYQSIVIIVCGGSGVSLELIDTWRKKFV